jgi:outer membrane biosynthesis protein TonB
MAVSAFYYRANLPWTVQPEDERFRLILLIAVLLMSLFGAAVSLISVPHPSREDIVVPPRLAKLIVQEKPKPPPPPPPVTETVEPPPPAAEKQAEPKPVPEPPKREKPPEKAAMMQPPPAQPSARERAARTGLLALSNELADLRSDAVVANLEQQPLRKGGTAQAGSAATEESTRAIITAQAAAGSGGINTSRLSRATGGTQLAGRETTRVTAPVEVAGAAPPVAGDAKTGALSARSSEEIQVIFDRNKGALNAIYNRALRLNPALAGKVVLRLTIAPSGAVTACELISSELKDPELEHKLIARVQLFDFGQKSATATTITYPIDFFPG